MFNLKLTGRKIWKQIDHSNKILLHCHPGPDGDCVGSSLAFYHVLKNMGKDVVLIQGDNSIPNNLSSLPGIDKITPKNIFQIDLNQFDLFIINDSSSIKQITRLGDFKFPKKLVTVVIDHHLSSEKFAKINLVLPKYPATCQILFELFQLRKIRITPKIAACLYIGLYTDSGGFKYVNTTYKTLSIASVLARVYPNFTKLIFNHENSDQPDRLKFISVLLSSIENYYSDHVAVASITYSQIQSLQFSTQTLNNYSEISNMLKSVVGWDIAITMMETQPNVVKVSFRTRDSKIYDLSKIALATKSGGGHRAAAGATLNQPLDEAKKNILNIIKKTYPKIDRI
jgi:phosphoesterase RecJ-like protein